MLGGKAQVSDGGTDIFRHCFGILPPTFELDGMRVYVLFSAIGDPAGAGTVGSDAAGDVGARG